MSDLESRLPPPLQEALLFLRGVRDAGARVDSIQDNFAYIWISNLAKNTTAESRGGWVRLPLAFPHANPHGLITREGLMRRDGGSVIDGYNPGHDMCNPVRALGGCHYYSWTWEGAPPLTSTQDIVGVVQWYERRIRNG